MAYSVLTEKIIRYLNEFKDEKMIQFAAQNYPAKLKVIGVVSKNEKKVITLLKELCSTYSEREKIILAKHLNKTCIFECQHIVFEWIGKDIKLLNALDLIAIEDFDKNLDNWLSVDSYSGYLLGPAWNFIREYEKKLHSRVLKKVNNKLMTAKKN